MSNGNTYHNDDEIDLFELFETLLDGKWIIAIFVILSTFSGFIYLQIIKPEYKLSTSYNYEIYPVVAQQTCGNNIKCMDGILDKKLSRLVDNEWIKKKDKLQIKKSNTLDVEKYTSDLKKYEKELTSEIYNEAKKEILLIENQSNDFFSNSESISENLLNSKRIINNVDSGMIAINFRPISIEKLAPKVYQVIAMSIILGGIMGGFFVLIRKAIHNRKNHSMSVQ